MKDERAGVIGSDGFREAGTGYSSGKTPRRFLSTFVIVSMIVIVPVTIAGIFFGINVALDYRLDYQDIYSHTASLNASNHLMLDLQIQNEEGDIFVDNNIDSQKLYEIETEVYTNKEGRTKYLDDQWQIENVENTTVLQFIAGSTTTDFLEDVRIKYNHYIHINNKANLTISSVSTISGKLRFELNTINITNILLDTTSGSIDLSLEDTSVLGDFHVMTVSGSQDIVIENSILEFSNMEIESASGSVNMVLDHNLFPLTTYMTIDITSGGFDAELIDNDFQGDFNLDIKITSGTNDLYLKQSQLDNEFNINADTTSGGIYIDLELSPNISTTYSGTDKNFPDNHSGTTGSVNVNAETTSGGIDVSYTSI